MMETLIRVSIDEKKNELNKKIPFAYSYRAKKVKSDFLT